MRATREGGGGEDCGESRGEGYWGGLEEEMKEVGGGIKGRGRGEQGKGKRRRVMQTGAWGMRSP